MPPKKRTTKNDSAPTATPISPAVTPDKSLVAKKAAAAESAAKAAAAKPAARRPAASRAKAERVAEAAVIQVPVLTETAAAPKRVAITEDDIRRHAFYLSQRRAGPGDPVADWLEAERSLRNQRA